MSSTEPPASQPATSGAAAEPSPAGSSGGLVRMEPLDPPMVPFAVAGIVLWAVAGLVLWLFFSDWLAAHGHTDWLWICLAGFLVGFPGLAVMFRHDANRRARRQRSPGS